MELQNQRIVITGGTSGIGLQIVEQLAPNNHITILGRDPKKLSHCKEQYPQVQTLEVDLSQPTQVESIGRELAKRFTKGLDLLIHNAAIQYTPTLIDPQFRFESIQEEVNLNLVAPCSLTYLLLPTLQKSTSTSLIMMVNSGLALAPKRSSAIYCSTKAALNNLALSLNYQLEESGVKVLQAFLPLVETAMTEGRPGKKLTPKQAAKEIIQGISKEIQEHDIGKVKLLRKLLRVSPRIARNILKRS